MRIRDTLSVKFAELVYNGYWFAPEMEFLNASLMQCQEVVTGSVDLQLFKGNVIERCAVAAFRVLASVLHRTACVAHAILPLSILTFPGFAAAVHLPTRCTTKSWSPWM